VSKPQDHLEKPVVVYSELAPVLAIELESLVQPYHVRLSENILEREINPMVVEVVLVEL
jgi:hypothetical protein